MVTIQGAGVQRQPIDQHRVAQQQPVSTEQGTKAQQQGDDFQAQSVEAGKEAEATITDPLERDKQADNNKTELSKDFYKGVTDDPKVQEELDNALFAEDSKLNKEEKREMAEYLVKARTGELPDTDKAKLEGLLKEAGMKDSEIEKILKGEGDKELTSDDIAKFTELLKKVGLDESQVKNLLGNKEKDTAPAQTQNSPGQSGQQAGSSPPPSASPNSNGGSPSQSAQSSPPAGQVPAQTTPPRGGGGAGTMPPVQADPKMATAYKEHVQNITGVESLSGELAGLAADDPMNIILHAIAREHNYESGKVTGLASHDYHAGAFQIPTVDLRDSIGQATGEDVLFKMPLKNVEQQAQMMSYLIKNTEIFGNAGEVIQQARSAKASNNNAVYQSKMAEGLQLVLTGLGAERTPGVPGIDSSGMPNGQDIPSSLKNYAGMIEGAKQDIQQTGLKFNAVTNDELQELAGNNTINNGIFSAQQNQSGQNDRQLQLVA